MLGIYVHVPFCLRKCPYCSFYSERFDEDTAARYADAVCRNVRAYSGRGLQADTLYFGGGTPSLLTAEQVCGIVKECRQAFLLDNAEITLEANPCTVSEQKLCDLRAAGVNRLSFGIQSADDTRLSFLGRLHDFNTAAEAVKMAKNAGFDNISGDLMLGAAGETGESLRKTIEAMCYLPLTHISAYMLKIEEGTPFYIGKEKYLIADDDLMSELYLAAVEELGKHGFKQYEISNFARPGFESRHNNKYWECKEYLGFGAAAHSFFEGVRYFCPPDLRLFIENELQLREVTESAVDPAEEYLLLGLRLCKGILLGRVSELFSERAAQNICELAKKYSNYGLVSVRDDTVCLTPKGFLVSNTLIGEFIDAAYS